MDYNQARFNMVEQQIRPWDVLNFDLLDVLHEIPREIFVTESYQSFAYADMSLPLQNGGGMLEPKIVARLIQALELNKNSHVLEIATGSGYATAILAKLAKTVNTFDIDEQQLNFAKNKLDSINIHNVSFHVQDVLTEEVGIEQYDAIYIGGGVRFVPESLKAAVKNGGYLVAIIGHGTGNMHATLMKKENENWITSTLFDTQVTYLEQKNAKPSFEF